MIRSVAAILAAIRLVSPRCDFAEKAAEHLQIVAGAQGFDPLTAVAYVEHESGWNPNVVGQYAAGEMIGLGQIRLENYQPCWPGGEESACQEQRAKLLDWEHNLTETARMFATWRVFCQSRTGKSDARYWLQGMMGWDAQRKTVCGHRRGKALPVPSAVLRVLKRRAELATRVGR